MMRLIPLQCYEEQLERARDVKDSSIEAQACGNLGITKMNTSQYEEAIGLFEQQLAMLEQVSACMSRLIGLLVCVRCQMICQLHLMGDVIGQTLLAVVWFVDVWLISLLHPMFKDMMR